MANIKIIGHMINSNIIALKKVINDSGLTHEDVIQFKEYLNIIDNTLWIDDPTTYREYLQNEYKSRVELRLEALSAIFKLIDAESK